ncbi:MAG: hypothetical protein WDM89_17700 [Rhizomicrobium sp.]
MAEMLARTLPGDYSFAALEQALAREVSAFPTFLGQAADGCEDDIAEKAAFAKANPSQETLRHMTAAERLAHANKKQRDDAKAAEAEARKEEVKSSGFDSGKPLSAAQRLSLANSWKGVGVDLRELDKRKPMTIEQLRSLDASQRLTAANREEQARKNVEKPKK